MAAQEAGQGRQAASPSPFWAEKRRQVPEAVKHSAPKTRVGGCRRTRRRICAHWEPKLVDMSVSGSKDPSGQCPPSITSKGTSLFFRYNYSRSIKARIELPIFKKDKAIEIRAGMKYAASHPLYICIFMSYTCIRLREPSHHQAYCTHTKFFQCTSYQRGRSAALENCRAA